MRIERRAGWVEHDVGAIATVQARHVSSEGCQFVAPQSSLEEGQRLAFTLEGQSPVRGVVRWVVQDRIGFAFDDPIPREVQRMITQSCRLLRGLRVFAD